MPKSISAGLYAESRYLSNVFTGVLQGLDQVIEQRTRPHLFEANMARIDLIKIDEDDLTAHAIMLFIAHLVKVLDIDIHQGVLDEMARQMDEDPSIPDEIAEFIRNLHKGENG